MVKMQSLLCVRCGGTLKSTSSSKAVCEYCKTEYAVSESDLPAAGEESQCGNGIVIKYDFTKHTVPDPEEFVFACDIKSYKNYEIYKHGYNDPFWNPSAAAFLKTLYWVCWSEKTTPHTIDDFARAVLVSEARNNETSPEAVLDAFLAKAEQQIGELPSNINNQIALVKSMPDCVKRSLFINYAANDPLVISCVSEAYEMSA